MFGNLLFFLCWNEGNFESKHGTMYFETLHIIRFELSWANRLFQVRSESRSDGFCCYPSVTTHLSSFLYISYLYNLLVSLYRGGQCGQKNTERDWELKEYLECSCNPQPPPPWKTLESGVERGKEVWRPGIISSTRIVLTTYNLCCIEERDRLAFRSWGMLLWVFCSFYENERYWNKP